MTRFLRIVNRVPYRREPSWLWLFFVFLAALGGGAVLLVLSGGVGMLLFGRSDIRVNLFILTGQVLALAPMLLTLWGVPPFGKLGQKLGIRPLQWIDLGIILAGYAVILIFGGLLTWLWQSGLDYCGIPYAAEQEDLTYLIRNLSGYQLVWLVMLVAGAVPVLEEIFFRRCLYGLLRPLGNINAFLICGIIFAAVHGFLLGFPALMLMGFIFQFVYNLRRNLLIPILLHMTVNAVAFVSILMGWE